jgi:hypothetical protein
MTDQVAKKEAKRMARTFGPLGAQLMTGLVTSNQSPQSEEDILAKYRMKDDKDGEQQQPDVYALQHQLKHFNMRPQVEVDYLAQYKAKEGEEPKLDKIDLQSYKSKKKENNDFLQQYRLQSTPITTPPTIEATPTTQGAFMKAFEDVSAQAKKGEAEKDLSVDPLAKYRVTASPREGRSATAGTIVERAASSVYSEKKATADPLDKYRVKSPHAQAGNSGDSAKPLTIPPPVMPTGGRGADTRLLRYFEELPPPPQSQHLPHTALPIPVAPLPAPIANDADNMTVEEIDREIKRLTELKKKKMAKGAK